MLGLAATLLSLAPPADAHGRRAGWFVGGLVVGAALAPRHVIAAPVYVRPWPHLTYAPPVIYAPPPVVYAPPPAVVYAPPPAVYASPPAPAHAAPPAIAPHAMPSIEERLRRLRSLCDEGLLTPHECAVRREQILREL
ncbi:MAG: hypothetical protein JNM90_02655 [Burkholderiales bacterium]|nr:hypothetical protein [Burkholderiales bacterium]